MTKWLNWQQNTETEPKKGGMEAQDLNGEFVCLFDFLFLDFSLIGNQIVFQFCWWMSVRQNLGMILEKTVVQKLKLGNNFFTKIDIYVFPMFFVKMYYVT